jgi:hypothetical protein
VAEKDRTYGANAGLVAHRGTSGHPASIGMAGALASASTRVHPLRAGAPPSWMAPRVLPSRGRSRHGPAQGAQGKPDAVNEDWTSPEASHNGVGIIVPSVAVLIGRGPITVWGIRSA